MMAFGPNGWNPSQNLKIKINRVYQTNKNSIQDPFLKGSPPFYEPEDDRLRNSTIEVDHVFAQGTEDVLSQLRMYVVSGLGNKQAMCNSCMEMKPLDDSILCLCNRYFCLGCVDSSVCESAGEKLCSSCTAAVERHANPLMCADEDDSGDDSQEEVMIDDGVDNAHRALEDEVCAVCCLGVCDNDESTAIDWCLSCMQPRHRRCAAQSGTSVCCVDSPYLKTMGESERDKHRVRLEVMHTKRNSVIGCDPGVTRIAEDLPSAVEELSTLRDMDAFEVLAPSDEWTQVSTLADVCWTLVDKVSDPDAEEQVAWEAMNFAGEVMTKTAEAVESASGDGLLRSNLIMKACTAVNKFATDRLRGPPGY